MTPWARAGGCAGSNYTFLTDKERDAETGLDFFEARYYSSTQGRFTSVDPLMASGRSSAPQSWNRYTYALNNPLLFTDPDGQDPGDFYDESGKKIGTDGKNDGKAYFVTDKNEAQQVAAANKQGGTTQVGTLSSALELLDHKNRQAQADEVTRSNSPSGADTKGGFHEEADAFIQTANGVTNVQMKPGPLANAQGAEIIPTDAVNPAIAATATSPVLETFSHDHPAGVVDVTPAKPLSPTVGTTIGGTETITQRAFVQTPSGPDQAFAGKEPGRLGYHMEIGARDKMVYFYNSSRQLGHMPLDKYKKIP